MKRGTDSCRYQLIHDDIRAIENNPGKDVASYLLNSVTIAYNRLLVNISLMP